MSDNEDDIFKTSDSESDAEVDLESDAESEVEKNILKDDDEVSDAEPDAEPDDEEDAEPEEEEEDQEVDYGDEGESEADEPAKIMKKALPPKVGYDSDEDEDADADEHYLQKFDTEIKKNYIVDFHPECMIHNYEEITALTVVLRDKDDIIIDPLHRTVPFLTKYERARVLGQRAKQLNSGARPFVKVPENVIDGYLIADLELMQKRIPFIIRRPLPGSSGCEYWNLKDLEIIVF